MKKPLLVYVMAAMLLLGGCTTTTAGAPSPTPKATKARLVVSEAATCSLLINSEAKGPLADAEAEVSAIVKHPDGSTSSESKVAATIESLHEAEASAKPGTQIYIAAVIKPLKNLDNVLNGGGNGTLQFDDFKAASLELLYDCIDF